MKKIKVLNLYAGIGGNRKLWPKTIIISGITYRIEVTAIEINPEIAKIYQDFFPEDKIIVADAHQYLLEHFKEFDFIWTSPPCPTHSKVRFANQTQNKPVYPDMKLYEEILLLEGYFEGKWVVENVFSWYDPLKKPFLCGKHFYWSNFNINELSKMGNKGRGMGKNENLNDLYKLKGFDLSDYNNINKMKTIRNCVEPKAGLHIFNCAYKTKQETLM